MYTSAHHCCIVMSLRTVCPLNPLYMPARAQDPSGRMRAAVHRDVLEMEKGIDVGTALVLSDVTLFRGADAHDDAAGSTMIVTTRNVTSVFHSFDCRGTSAHNERGSRRPLLPHEKKLKSNANAAPLLPLPAPQQCTASFKGRVEGVAHPDEKARGSRSAAGGGDGAARSNAHGDPATISGRYQGELGPVDVAPEPLTARYGNRADDQSRLIASAGGGKDTAGHLKRTRPDPTRDQENNRPLDLEQRHNFDPGDAIKQMKTGTAAAGAAAAPRSRVGEDDDELTAMLRMMESDCDGDFGV